MHSFEDGTFVLLHTLYDYMVTFDRLRAYLRVEMEIASTCSRGIRVQIVVFDIVTL